MIAIQLVVKLKNMTHIEIPKGIVKVGDFIKSTYKCSPTCGIVTKILKNRIFYTKYHQNYNKFFKLNVELSCRPDKVYQIGLNEGEVIK